MKQRNMDSPASTFSGRISMYAKGQIGYFNPRALVVLAMHKVEELPRDSTYMTKKFMG